jgi:serine/threonine-protein kinase
MADASARLAAALADRYAIERELGQGGMATVYLAQDLKHDRQVAIKVLKPELAAVLGAERFVQEIKTTAALSHPHILPLFDSGEASGFLYYVMPYLEGETIREKLSRETQLGIEEAVRITTEVADALDYAHRHGVIHRDIKPENLLLHDRRVMVMDFGIALALSAAAGGRMTETGLSLGTPHYMSPEQATADRDITARSDIYSLASVLYEMLTGEPPHMGTSAQQIIMKIVTEEAAPVTRLRKSVPPNVAAAVAKALEKLPADRFETAQAFGAALADPGYRHGERGGATGTATAARPRTRDPVFLAVGAAAVLAVAGLVWMGLNRAAGPAGPVTYDVALPDSAPLAITGQQPFSVARDGRFVVYQALEKDGSALWYRSLGNATARRIDGTEQGRRPAISPDGSRVAYLRFRSPPKWTLEIVPVMGGAATTLGDGSGEANLQWLEDGRIQVVEGDGAHARWFDPGGGTTTDLRIGYCLLPSPLPGRNHMLCGGGGQTWAYGDSAGVVTPFWTGSPDSTQVFGSNFRIVDGRYLVYLSIGGDLLAAPVDVSTRRVGRSVRLVTGLDRSAYFGFGSYGLSSAGTLVYALGSNRAVGNLVTTDGRFADTLAVGRDAFHLFALSPDGRRLATVVDGLQRQELRIYDLRSGEHQTWVRRPLIHQPVWSPRGDRLLFSGRDSVFVGNPDRSQPPELVAPAPDEFEAFKWIDGDRVIGGLWNTYLAMSLDLTKHPAAWDTLATDATFAVASPDGRWLAYNDVDESTVWLAPLPAGGRRYQVASGSVGELGWLHDREFTFLSWGDNYEPTIIRASMDVSGGTPVVARRDWMKLPGFIDTAGESYQLTPDGRVLYVRGANDEPKRYLRVIPNWATRMKRAVDEANQ